MIRNRGWDFAYCDVSMFTADLDDGYASPCNVDSRRSGSVVMASEPATTNGQRATNGEHKPTATGGEGKGNLADRIRALQLKASRVPVTN